MLEFIHVLIIFVISVLGYIFFLKPQIINIKLEKFNSDNINVHSGDDYNINE